MDKLNKKEVLARMLEQGYTEDDLKEYRDWLNNISDSEYIEAEQLLQDWDVLKKLHRTLPRLYTDEEIKATSVIRFGGACCLGGPYCGRITDPEQIRIIMEGCRVQNKWDETFLTAQTGSPTSLFPNGSDKSFIVPGFGNDTYRTDKDPDYKILYEAINSNKHYGLF